MSDIQTRFFPCETNNRSNNPIPAVQQEEIPASIIALR